MPRRYFPLLTSTAASIGSHQIRNRATVGGNICNDSEAFDLAPALLCYDALCYLWGPKGGRTTPLESLYLDAGGLALEVGELLVRVTAPMPGDDSVGVYHKLTQGGPRTVAGVAVHAHRGEGGRYSLAHRLDWCGAASLSAYTAEAALANALPNAKMLAKAIDLAMNVTQPVDDLYASASYRRAMIPVLMRRGVETVVAQLWRGTK